MKYLKILITVIDKLSDDLSFARRCPDIGVSTIWSSSYRDRNRQRLYIGCIGNGGLFVVL